MTMCRKTRSKLCLCTVVFGLDVSSVSCAFTLKLKQLQNILACSVGTDSIACNMLDYVLRCSEILDFEA